MFSSNTTQVSDGGYQISRSLRFNSADSAYLNRTPATTTNRTTWTWSGWVKRASFGSSQVLFGAGPDGSNYTIFYFSGTVSEDLEIFNYTGGVTTGYVYTNSVFRDPSAWYHVVLAVDTTQGTSADRTKIYVNNVLQPITISTTFGSSVNTWVNTNNNHRLGSTPTTSALYGGYMTDVNFVDGSQLTPSSFGETNADTGIWQPKAYSGSYGTNGFYLNFSDNSNTTAATLGKDYSGNGNNWTPNNFSVTAGAGNDSLVDSPTSYGTDTGVGGTVRGNYATLNPLKKGTSVSLANGNLDFSSSDAAGSNVCLATMGMSSGKWYWEVTPTSTAIGAGIATDAVSLNIYLGQDAFGWMYYNNGFKYNNASGSSYGASYASGDVIGFAFDADAGSITCYKNGTSQGVMYSSLAAGTYFPAVSDADASTCTATANFGQRPFAYTAPSGFKALCTQNLPTPTIGATTATQANKYFEPTLYTGTNANLTVTNSGGFQPDFIWIKLRSSAGNHVLANSIGGPNKVMYSSQTTAEETSNAGTGITAITSTGFTLGTELAGTTYGSTNYNTYAYVAWNWKANGSGSTNTAGSITSTVSANTTSGFSVVTYTGTGANATVGHGLGIAPKMVIVKNRTSTGSWCTWHTGLTSGAYALFLESTDAQGSYPTIFNSTVPTSTVFSVGTATGTNASANNLVAYCFAEVAGYSKFGSYTGNGSADGPFVYTGFRPAYLLVKQTNGTNYWFVFDSARDTSNVVDLLLDPNDSRAEISGALFFDFLSNGFKSRATDAGQNASGGTYIYMAFASNPFKYSLAF